MLRKALANSENVTANAQMRLAIVEVTGFGGWRSPRESTGLGNGLTATSAFTIVLLLERE